ncbi:hypothetical protein NC651_033109 [Populus alba x Populus x berolinensis]|nr:hypothetical protein NC651_033109 [Populus alba x Populus x berolinensis]
MARCSVSMQVCPATPLWFCKCCCRRASKLPPETPLQCLVILQISSI